MALYLTGNAQPEYWGAPAQKVTFYELKGVVERILERVGIQGVTMLPLPEGACSFGQEGLRLQVGDTALGGIGIIKQSVLKDFGIKQEVFFADLQWEAILQLAQGHKVVYKEIAKYPEVRRDLALLIDEQISFAQIHQLAFQTEKSLLKSVNLFDVYQGDKLPKGKKSYAVSFILQDDNKTLTDKQIEKTMTHLQTAFKEQLGAELR